MEEAKKAAKENELTEKEKRVILNATMLLRNPSPAEYFAFLTENTLGKSRYEPLSAEDLFYFKFIEVMELNFTDSPSIPTAGVTLSGKTQKPYVIFLNRDFAMSLTPEETYAVIKHELAHIMHMHTDMLKDYEKNVEKYIKQTKEKYALDFNPGEALDVRELHKIDNMAEDAQINGLSEENPIISNLPKFAVYHDNFIETVLKWISESKKVAEKSGDRKYLEKLEELEDAAEELGKNTKDNDSIESIPLFQLGVATVALMKKIAEKAKDVDNPPPPFFPPFEDGPEPPQDGPGRPGEGPGVPVPPSGSGDGPGGGGFPVPSDGEVPEGAKPSDNKRDGGKPVGENETDKEGGKADEKGEKGGKKSDEREKGDAGSEGGEKDPQNGKEEPDDSGGNGGGKEEEKKDKDSSAGGKDIGKEVDDAARKTSGGSDKDTEDMVSKMSDEEKRKVAGIDKEEWKKMSEDEKKNAAKEGVEKKIKEALEGRRKREKGIPGPIDVHTIEEEFGELEEDAKEIIENTIADATQKAAETVREEINNGNARGNAPCFASELIKAKLAKPAKKRAFPTLKEVLSKMSSNFKSHVKGRNKKRTRPFELPLLGNKRTKMTGLNMRGREEQKLPPVYVLLDTSGSMSKADLEVGIRELINITKGSNIPVYMIPVDAGVYGDPFELKPNFDFKKGVELFGRGGTYMTPGIVKALKHAYLQNKEEKAPEGSKMPTAPIPRDKYGEPPAQIGVIILTDGGIEERFDFEEFNEKVNGKHVDYARLAKERIGFLGIAVTGDYDLFLDLEAVKKQLGKDTKIQILRWTPEGFGVERDVNGR